jgi:hypothetical protein
LLLALVAGCDDTPAPPSPAQGSIAVFRGPDLVPSVYAAPGARAVSVVDLDGDGHLDLVAAGGGVSVLDGSNHFNGTYYEGAFATGSRPSTRMTTACSTSSPAASTASASTATSATASSMPRSHYRSGAATSRSATSTETAAPTSRPGSSRCSRSCSIVPG